MSKKSRGLTTKIFIGLLVGLIVGIVVYQLPDGTFKNNILIDGIFQLLGQVFLRGIMMMVVPLVFISLVNGASSMGDVKKLGRVGARTILFYLVTTAFAVTLALALGYLIKPGTGLDLGTIEQVETTVSSKTPLVQILYEMVPRNPIAAMGEGNMLQIIVFAIITGIGLSTLGEKVKIVVQIFEQLNELIIKMVGFVMLFAPIGVFGLIARTFATVGYAALVPLLKYIIAVYIGLILHAGLIYSGMLKGLTGLSPKIFFKKIFPAMSVAFSTASSGATVPINLDINEKEFGVSRNIASFTIPLGATINMDGTAIMQGVATFFIAQVYNVPLSIGAILTVVLTATLASIGTAGVPGAGTIMLSMVLQSIGLPIEGIGLIMGIDRLVDMGRTAVNITGDAACTVIIAKKEGELKEEIFNSDSKELSK
ncbi:dicarboxylate/amino acid:cation symporter [Schnuerera sp.]|uniref:dicarboxylate/amino acid:cation symporter n=1 Tax=Schnuerera sp. TaxID=2794844 RepID=UPI002D04CBA0|nr:dicarboxylate/amino acid:cation symporter [Schnuerera sp.]HSH35326.1 dicarboxylate/amino acid:cation symporter [Schnuerera sp.]